MYVALCGRINGQYGARESESVSFSHSGGEWSVDRRKGGGAEPWYFKARHWHKSPQRRRGSGSSQGRVGRAMGQPLPGLACWYLQMSSLKSWRSLLLLKRSPERLGSCSRAEGTQRGPLWPNTAAPCQWAPPASRTPTLQYTAGYSPSRPTAS